MWTRVMGENAALPILDPSLRKLLSCEGHLSSGPAFLFSASGFPFIFSFFGSHGPRESRPALPG